MTSSYRAPSAESFPDGDREVLAKCWHPVALSDAVKADAPHAVRLLDQDVVLYRAQEGLVAAPDLCPHRGASLSLGKMRDGRLECPYHGYRYDGVGRCVLIPAHPGAPIPSKLALRRFETTERYGLIWVCLDPPASFAVPEFPAFRRDGFQVIPLPPFDWACSAGRQIEAIADVAHFPFVHPSSFAAGDSRVSAIDVTVPSPGVIHADFTSRVANRNDRAAAEFAWRRVYDLSLPFTIQVDITFPDEGTLVIFNACSPTSAFQTRVFSIVSKNFGLEQPALEVIDFQMKVYGEDQRVVERQSPKFLPLDLREEVHVKADRISVEYRRQLARLGLGRALHLEEEWIQR